MMSRKELRYWLAIALQQWAIINSRNPRLAVAFEHNEIGLIRRMIREAAG